jgi:uncharacterized protein (TIGR03067 family)
MRRLLTAIAAVGLLAWVSLPTPASTQKEEKDDQDRFQGEWVMTAAEQGGQELPEELAKTGSWSVKGTKYTFKIGETTEDGSFKLGPDKKPTSIVLDIKTGNDAGKKQGGIYKFKDDTAVICFSRPGDETIPKEFSTDPEKGSGFFMITLKKKPAKPKDEDKDK